MTFSLQENRVGHGVFADIHLAGLSPGLNKEFEEVDNGTFTFQ